ncbi:MAG TPA: ribose-phosphate pyrophosphokinase [Anaeromyxobacteraceae bacterium]|jgi:ribose-phosphate pyrophosphokinase
MTPLIITGSAHPSLAEGIASELESELAACLVQRFPDGELRVEVQACVRGQAVFVVQPLGPPVGEHLLELLLLADACHRAGAGSVAAVVPYVGYARQDRVAREGQPLGARVLAEALGTGRFSQILAVDLHAPAVASCARAPVAHLTAVPALVEALRPQVRDDWVVVAPDLGAVKLAEAYARPLGLPLAVVHKHRISGTEVAVEGVAGDVRGKRPLVVDDMISTGATVEAALDALLAQGCRSDVTVAATHGLLVGEAVERLGRPELARTLVADSLPPPRRAPERLEVVRLAPLLADAVRRIGAARGLGDLLAAR